MRHLAARRGVAVHQYALILGLIAVVSLLAVTLFGVNVRLLLERISLRLNNGTVNSGGPAGGGAQAQLAQAYGWGQGTAGQLGQGAFSNAYNPVGVTLPGSVTQISVAANRACALVDSTAWCWGSGQNGAHGNGSTSYIAAPAQVTAASGISRIAAGARHSCAIVGGGLKCWGANENGQLGNGGSADSLTAVDPTGMATGVTQVSAGEVETCAVVAGATKCWGYNGSGEIGDGTSSARSTPTDVQGLGGAPSQISTGTYLVCAIVSGAAKCWGNGISGQVGDGMGLFTNATARNVSGLGSGTTRISAGFNLACAVANNAAYCWGENDQGQIGNAATGGVVLAPASVSGLSSGVSDIAAGYKSACALLSSGAVKCWGDNAFGQLGNGTTADSAIPVDVGGMGGGVTLLGAGFYNAIGVK